MSIRASSFGPVVRFVIPMLVALAPALSSCAESATVVPAPTLDEPAAAAGASETAVLAGGCFWGVQGVFQHLKGVKQVLSGYAGGSKDTAEYETVGTGRTGHAESVQITFDPREVSYGRILQIYFSVAHDPTQLNRQGPDRGSQYRSAIFPTSPEQAKVAEGYIAQLNQAKAFDKTIATKIEGAKPFYPAELYHQDYLTLNPRQPYINQITYLYQIYSPWMNEIEWGSCRLIVTS